MGRIGEVGIRESFQARMGWACGNLFVWDGRILGGFLSMILVRARRFAFWDDVWCGDRALKEEYPSLFNIARFKEASIVDNMERSSDSIQLNIQFTRLIHDWEVGELASFYKCLYDCKLRGEGRDKLWWVHSCKGLFEVKSFYRALSPRGSVSFSMEECLEVQSSS
jgi:hypothetical protein